MTSQSPAFTNEETPSTKEYPEVYGPRSIAEQVARLRARFPRLAIAEPTDVPSLPAGAEAWFVVPDWRRVGATYNAAVVECVTVLGDTRDASLSRLDRLGPDRFRQHERSMALSGRLRHVAGSDLLLVAAQFGLRHRGCSIRRARERFAPNEFGLGVFAVASMLIAHPERIARFDQLYVDCAGDEYSASDEQQFSEAPYFRYLSGRLAFGTSWVGYTDQFFGSASAFT